MMKSKIIIMVVLLAMTGCTYYGSFGGSVRQENISLTWRNTLQVDYYPQTFQIGYNDSTNEYRVYDDRLAYWFMVRCSEKPVEEGQELTADISWTGKSKTMTLKEVKVTVEKMDDESGLVWLWSQSERISIVIKNI